MIKTMHVLNRKNVILVLYLFGIGCAGRGVRIEPDPGVEPSALSGRQSTDIIHVQYLGIGGYLLWRDGYGLLTAPLFSNPGIFRVGLGRITTDTLLINQLFPRCPGVQIGAILVGHAHYDHLLDVPYIARRHAPEAMIYGSASTGRIVRAAEPSLADRMMVVEEQLSRRGLPGKWIYLADSMIRFMAIESDHGAHALGIHVMRGEVRQGLKKVPGTAWAWKEGTIIAYLIDFLSPEGNVDFRVHYQDATSHYPLGAPPTFAPEDSHRVDLAIVAVGSWFQVKDYPGAFLRHHQPRHVILGHWEGFFRSPLKPPHPIPYSARLRSFVPYVEGNLPADSDWLLPRPGAVYPFHPTRVISQ